MFLENKKTEALCKRFVLTVHKKGTEKIYLFFSFPFRLYQHRPPFSNYVLWSRAWHKAHTECVEIKCCQGNFCEANLKHSERQLMVSFGKCVCRGGFRVYERERVSGVGGWRVTQMTI